MKEYKWQELAVPADWTVTYKIDGINVLYKDGVPLSRKNKPLYNLPEMPDGMYECFLGTMGLSQSATRTHNGTPIKKEDLYMLEPKIDARLECGRLFSTRGHIDDIKLVYEDALKRGYEGLVLRNDDGTRLKLKPNTTYDVPITDIQPGKGKNKGRMGALLTPKGKVGTGFTDAERAEEWEIGSIIEVKCMHLTDLGKFRHPSFVRRREDRALEERDY